jgi:hypothetical protein
VFTPSLSPHSQCSCWPLGIAHFVSGASGCIYPPWSAAPLSERDYAVYDVALSSFRANQEHPHITVGEDAGWDWSERRTYLGAARSLPGTSRELVCSFAASNREIQRLDPAAFPEDSPVAVVSAAVLDTLFTPLGPDLWERFYQRYPSSPGLLTVSGVGYGRDGTQALVTVEQTCGILCGEGQIFLLALVEGRWTILENHRIWIS